MSRNSSLEAGAKVEADWPSRLDWVRVQLQSHFVFGLAFSMVKMSVFELSAYSIINFKQFTFSSRKNQIVFSSYEMVS